jgi:Na+/proline symporter
MKRLVPISCLLALAHSALARDWGRGHGPWEKSSIDLLREGIIGFAFAVSAPLILAAVVTCFRNRIAAVAGLVALVAGSAVWIGLWLPVATQDHPGTTGVLWGIGFVVAISVYCTARPWMTVRKSNKAPASAAAPPGAPASPPSAQRS